VQRNAKSTRIRSSAICVVTKFMNAIMIDGKKVRRRAHRLWCLDQVEARSKSDPVEVFHQALDNVAPHVEVRSRRVGGATYQVPVEVRPSAVRHWPSAG
jgi:small subunit ribosomal protein S7